jgi:putative inorganic carbon (hco3(-)) transporter
MTVAAPVMNRRSLLQYAVGFDLVLIALGIGLLLPPRSAAPLAPFIVAVGLAALRGGWKVGLVTTALSIVFLLIGFGGAFAPLHLALFAVASVAASLLLGTPAIAAAPAEVVARPARPGHDLREVIPPFVMHVGLPLFVFVLFLNISSALVETFGVPSVLQPLILVLAGVVVGFRNVFQPGTTVSRSMTLALIAYVVFVFASSAWARDSAVADFELGDLVKSLLLLIVAGSLAASWRSLRGALVALVAAATVLSLLTLVQVALGRPDLTFFGLAEVEVGHLFGEFMQPRPSGPVGDPNYFARILIIAVPAAALLGIGRTSRRERLAYVAAAVAISTAILLTYSRGGMVSLAFVGFLLMLAGRVRVTWANALLAVVLIAALVPTPVGKRFLTIESLVGDETEDESVDKRRQLIGVAMQMVSDRPLFGVGVGNFGSHYPAYANQVGLSSQDYLPIGARQYPHNLFLEMATETGLVGLLLFSGAMFVTLATMFRARRTLLDRGEPGHAALVTALGIGVAGYLVASLFLHQGGFQRYLWLTLGLAAAASRLTESAREESGVKQ